MPQASKVPADLKDLMQDVAGAIAQTISSSPNTAGFTTAVQALLVSSSDAKGSLEATLAKAAGKYSGDVTAAFSDVDAAFLAHQANSSVSVIVPGNEVLGQAGIPNPSLGTGKYEIGSVVEEETPTKNI